MFGGSLVDRGHAVGPTRFSARLFVLRKEVGSPGSFAYVALAHDWADNGNGPTMSLLVLSRCVVCFSPCALLSMRLAKAANTGMRNSLGLFAGAQVHGGTMP